MCIRDSLYLCLLFLFLKRTNKYKLVKIQDHLNLETKNRKERMYGDSFRGLSPHPRQPSQKEQRISKCPEVSSTELVTAIYPLGSFMLFSSLLHPFYSFFYLSLFTFSLIFSPMLSNFLSPRLNLFQHCTGTLVIIQFQAGARS